MCRPFPAAKFAVLPRLRCYFLTALQMTEPSRVSGRALAGADFNFPFLPGALRPTAQFVRPGASRRTADGSLFDAELSGLPAGPHFRRHLLGHVGQSCVKGIDTPSQNPRSIRRAVSATCTVDRVADQAHRVIVGVCNSRRHDVGHRFHINVTALSVMSGVINRSPSIDRVTQIADCRTGRHAPHCWKTPPDKAATLAGTSGNWGKLLKALTPPKDWGSASIPVMRLRPVIQWIRQKILKPRSTK